MLRLVALAGVLASAAAQNDACGPGTIFDRASGFCVPGSSLNSEKPLLAPKLAVKNGDVRLKLPAGNRFSVKCPAGSDHVTCEGPGVTVDASGACVPVAQPLRRASMLDIIDAALLSQSNALADQLTAFKAEASAREEELAAQAAAAITQQKSYLQTTIAAIDAATKSTDSTADALKAEGAAVVTEGLNKLNASTLQPIVAGTADVLTAATAVPADVAACLKKGGSVGADGCLLAPKTTGFKSCYHMWLANKELGSEGRLLDGVYTISVRISTSAGVVDDKAISAEVPGVYKSADREVYCDFQTRFGDSTPGWTMVSRISRYSRKHMYYKSWGVLTADGPNQEKPWKLSDDDIFQIKEWNAENLPDVPINAYKFECSAVSDQRTHDGMFFRGFQYFDRACTFNANRRVDNYQQRRCHDWGPTETTEYKVTGYADSNDCGLGGHANHGTLASYGWHYCNNNGRRSGIDSQAEYQNPSSNTGCGHNNRESRGPMKAGDGTLWIK